MKIRPVSKETFPKVIGLLKQAFPGSYYEERLVEKLQQKDVKREEWCCIHKGKVIGYIAFTNAFKDGDICGWHLAPVAVKPEFQNQGVGAELIRFGLRQKNIAEQTVFVLGEPRYYMRFGFELCSNPVCPFDKNNRHFLGLRNHFTEVFTVGYEAVFYK